MSANQAKYLLSIAGDGTQNYQVTGFVGEDAISRPYYIDTDFCISGAARAVNAVRG
ncbi:MAG: hypothetical protein LBB74_06235 [Chitinispirillales bacterium]|jgi:hypothetical protein|nr:hypothetical protein [Chitinispirillales bacterium]